MKAILEFNLPEDQIEFEESSNAYKLSLVIRELLGDMRSAIKHDCQTPEEEKEVIEKWRSHLYKLIRDKEVLNIIEV